MSPVKTRKTRDEYNNILDIITDPIVIFDDKFKVKKINKAAKQFFTGYPIGKKCFFMRHKFTMACKDCPIWQTVKTGTTMTGEILCSTTGNPILLKTYPIYSRVKKVKGVILIGRESSDVPVKWKR
ncbi:MAG: hypothetical protein E3K32_10030 [wastewater metagenome]|nr:hypothetical protein [Candidatus Loosdrechtia aerotolerans]